MCHVAAQTEAVSRSATDPDRSRQAGPIRRFGRLNVKLVQAQDQRSQADLNEVASGHGCFGRDILWSSASPIQCGVLLTKGRENTVATASLQRKSVLAPQRGEIGHFLEVAPIETASAQASHRFP